MDSFSPEPSHLALTWPIQEAGQKFIVTNARVCRPETGALNEGYSCKACCKENGYETITNKYVECVCKKNGDVKVRENDHLELVKSGLF